MYCTWLCVLPLMHAYNGWRIIKQVLCTRMNSPPILTNASETYFHICQVLASYKAILDYIIQFSKQADAVLQNFGKPFISTIILKLLHLKYKTIVLYFIKFKKTLYKRNFLYKQLAASPGTYHTLWAVSRWGARFVAVK